MFSKSSRCEVGWGEKIGRRWVVAGGDASEVKLSKHALDGVAIAIEHRPPCDGRFLSDAHQLYLHGGKDHLVDDVNDTVVGCDIGGHDCRVVDHHAFVEIDLDLATLYRLGRHVVRQVRRHHFSGHDMIGEDGDELVLVFWLEEIFHRTRRKSGKGFIGRRKNGKRPLTLERLDQTGGLNRGDERFERTCLNGGVDYVREALEEAGAMISLRGILDVFSLAAESQVVHRRRLRQPRVQCRQWRHIPLASHLAGARRLVSAGGIIPQ